MSHSTIHHPTFLPNSKIPVNTQARLENYTTFRLGGFCRGLIDCQTPVQLHEAIKHLVSMKEQFILIGGGSNLVVSDQGLSCFVVRYFSEKPIVERRGNDVIVSGSTLLDKLALFCAEEGLQGLNYTSGIPGTVGGAVVGNAGAFGRQVGDVVSAVEVIDAQGQIRSVNTEQLGFQYRDSLLKKTGDIVSQACFTLTPGNREELLKERTEIIALRHTKHPDLQTHPCAGSFFRNIEPTSKADKRQAAGWFLEQVGAKSLKIGGAAIYEKHANIIVKENGCKAQDVYELSERMKKMVKDQFGFELVREVRFVGPFPHEPLSLNGFIW